MKYVLEKTTLRELYHKSESADNYGNITLYKYSVPRNFSDEQEKIQKSSNWYAKSSEWYSYREDVLYERAKGLMLDEVTNKRYKGDIAQKVYNRVMDEEIMVTAEVIMYETDNSSRVKIEYENKKEDGKEYSDDIKKFEKSLEEVKTTAPGQYGVKKEEREYVYLEEISADVHSWSLRDAPAKLRRLIKKLIREEYTYCLKKGIVIIPEEYLEKGEEGVREWRNLKSSTNKNNSMEKRMLKQIYRDKKIKATNYVRKVINSITSKNYSYDIPSLQVEGRWNGTKVDKLTNKIMNTKNKQQVLNMSDEEMLEKVKTYWKEILKQAYDQVDNCIDEK